ncbi:hypothetical protein MRX96_018348 [Rhipicephalus microplus]
MCVDEVGKCHCEATPRMQRVTDGTAIARIAVKNNVKCRSYGLCRRLTDESNYLGLSVFNALPEDRNVCLSIYAFSFLVPLIDAHVTDSKASFRETLKFGALVAKDGGRLACSCKEVLTTLRRREAASGEVRVNTETYLHPYYHECGTDSMRNGMSHVMTAELIADDPVSETAWNDVLFNTASFENLWKCPFSRRSTYTGSFFNKWTDQVTVQVMRRTGVLPYSYYHDLDADVVCLPYADGAPVHGANRAAVVVLRFPQAHSGRLSGFIFFVCGRRGVSPSTKGHWPAVSSERTSYAGAPVTVVVNKPFYFVITDKTSDLVLYAGKVISQ